MFEFEIAKTEPMFIQWKSIFGLFADVCVFFIPIHASQPTTKYIAKKISAYIERVQRVWWLITVEKYSEYFILSIVCGVFFVFSISLSPLCERGRQKIPKIVCHAMFGSLHGWLKNENVSQTIQFSAFYIPLYDSICNLREAKRIF